MHICEAQVCHYYVQSECYDLKFKTFAPTIPHSPSPLLTSTNCTPYSIPPVRQVHLAWLWTPRCHILLKALLVEARILHNVWRWDHALDMWALAHEGRGGWKENRKRWGRPVHVSLWVERLCRSFYFAFHCQLRLQIPSQVSELLVTVAPWYVFFRQLHKLILSGPNALLLRTTLPDCCYYVSEPVWLLL